VDPVSDTGREGTSGQPIPLPGTLTDGATVIVGGAFDPSEHALCLRLLAHYGRSADTALVVTTLASADETIETWDQVSVEGDRPSIGIVDTTSEEQSVAATYGGVPTFFTPSSGDLERIVMALSELSGVSPPTNGSRHLVFRSLTPIVREAPTERVCRVLERISGLRTGTGLGLFGVDIMAHDHATLAAIADTVDGVVWIDRTNDGGFESEFHPKRRHVPF
jgi:hypothetical protein